MKFTRKEGDKIWYDIILDVCNYTKTKVKYL